MSNPSKSQPTARQVAISALLRMEARDAWSGPALDHALTHSALSSQDRAFATALFYGVIARQYTLDYVIKQYSKRPFDKIDFAVLSILRTALYQVLYMDSVPDHAAVDQAVSLTRSFRIASASGFVNGILRGFLRGNKKISLKGLSPVQKLAVEYSAPPALVTLFLESYGTEVTKEILAQSLTPPATFLRVNTLKTTEQELVQELLQENITAYPVSGVPDALRLEGGEGALEKLTAYQQGLFHIQDLSSQKAAAALGAKPKELILDSCAAPGGKTFILCQQMKNTGTLAAVDLHPHRLDTLVARGEKLGLFNIETHALDMKEPHKELAQYGTFDRILTDVPCSGLGVIRRRPEIKYKNLQEFSALPQVQYQILSTSASYLKKGGTLVYSTCTLSPVENTQVVQRFLQHHPDFSPADTLPHWEQTMFPDQSGADGFYIAVLQRQ